MTALNQLLQVRNRLINIYKEYERFIVPALKFVLTISVLVMISNTIGYAKPLTKITTILVIGLMGTFLPPQLLMLLFILVASIHAGAGSLEAGIIVFLLMLIIYLLFIRLYPIESLFIVGTIIAYKFHVPYIIPLVAGLFGSLATVVALVIGIIIWYWAPEMIRMMGSQDAQMSDVVGVINAKLATLQEIFKTDQTLLASMIILAMVLLIVYVIRRQNIDYAEYLAILVGTVVNLIGFLFAIILFRVEVGIAGLMLSTIISGAIAMVAQFFSKAADYSRAEVVQFEDDANYYYVKVVPKIKMSKANPQRQYSYTKDSVKGRSHEN